MDTNKCTNCHESFYTFAKEPYCIKCIKNECCMSNALNCDESVRCNSTFDLVSLNGKKYCLGHYKTLQNHNIE